MARSGTFPAIKLKKRWLFQKEKIEDYININQAISKFDTLP
jgi:hypothetical protein